MLNNSIINYYLFSPRKDFFMLGGFSLIFGLFLTFFWPQVNVDQFYIMNIGALLSALINWPHFMFSYQLIYENFIENIKNKNFPIQYRYRLIFSGILVPISMIIIIFFIIYLKDVFKLGILISAMLFFSAWHYVKQGYGILIMSSARAKYYFNSTQKNILLLHTYAVWLLSVTAANRYSQSYDFFGVNYYSFNWGDKPYYFFLCVSSLSFAAIIYIFLKNFKNKNSFPPTIALFSYGISVYIWVLSIQIMPLHAVWIYFIPTAHSLQYITFVLYYKIKERNIQNLSINQIVKGIESFVLRGIYLGVAFFFFFPKILDITITKKYFSSTFNDSLFFVCFFIFINIHHFFIDNAIWRKENTKIHGFLKD
jgi:hypothetical protein